jgi:hypothetical protein
MASTIGQICTGKNVEEVATQFEVLSLHLSGETMENHENLSRDNRPVDRDLNPRPPECEATYGLILRHDSVSRAKSGETG